MLMASSELPIDSKTLAYNPQPLFSSRCRFIAPPIHRFGFFIFLLDIQRVERHYSYAYDNRVRVIFIALLIVAPLAGCGRKRNFPPLGQVSAANLWISAKDGSKYGWKISDPNDLSRIVAFVDSHRSDWSTPWFGVPVPIVEVQLFDGQQAQGSFGVGKDFLETQRDAFFSQSASPGEIRGFFDAANLDDATVKEYTK